MENGKDTYMQPCEYDTKSAVFSVHDKYVIAEPKIYVDVREAEVEQLFEIVSKHFKGKFGLIDNRVNEGSIDPMAYLHAKELMPNFSAFALVAYSNTVKENFSMESLFIKETDIKCKIFSSLEDAKEWMKNTL